MCWSKGGLTDLVQCGLCDGVVLDPQRLFVFGQDGEDVSERGERRRQLVLQHVPVFLLQRAAAQLALNELHDGQQVRVRPGYPQDDGVSVAKPATQRLVSLQKESPAGSRCA